MKSLIIIFTLFSVCIASMRTISLYAQKLGDYDKQSLAVLKYDLDNQIFDIIELNENIQQDLYCIISSNEDNYSPCISYIRLQHPLKYDLNIDLSYNNLSIYKLSVKPNFKSNGLVPVIRTFTTGAQPGIIKLKKVTKTYKDKKKIDPTSATASYQEDDQEMKEMSFFEKYWKYLLLGILVYTLTKNKSQNEAPTK